MPASEFQFLEAYTSEALMETQNVTLAIPKEALHRAKMMATQHRTSLSKLLTNFIVEMTTQDENYEAAKQRSLALMEKGFDMGTKGKITWTREELHDRG